MQYLVLEPTICAIDLMSVVEGTWMSSIVITVPYFVSVIEWGWRGSRFLVVTEPPLTVMVRSIIVVVFIIIVIVEAVVAANATSRSRLISSCGLPRLEIIVAALLAE